MPDYSKLTDKELTNAIDMIAMTSIWYVDRLKELAQDAKLVEAEMDKREKEVKTP